MNCLREFIRLLDYGSSELEISIQFPLSSPPFAFTEVVFQLSCAIRRSKSAEPMGDGHFGVELELKIEGDSGLGSGFAHKMIKNENKIL